MKLGCFLLRCSRSTKLLGSSEEAGLRELTKESGGREGGKGPQITRRPPQTFVACQQTRNSASSLPRLPQLRHPHRTHTLLPIPSLSPSPRSCTKDSAFREACRRRDRHRERERRGSSLRKTCFPEKTLLTDKNVCSSSCSEDGGSISRRHRMRGSLSSIAKEDDSLSYRLCRPPLPRPPHHHIRSRRSRPRARWRPGRRRGGSDRGSG